MFPSFLCKPEYISVLVVECFLPSLSESGAWSAWSTWTACDTDGHKYRTRGCTEGDAKCARMTEMERRDCYSPGCPSMF